MFPFVLLEGATLDLKTNLAYPEEMKEGGKVYMLKAAHV